MRVLRTASHYPRPVRPELLRLVMALRQTEEEQAVFDHALELVAEQGPMSQEEVDSLSMLEDADLARFHDVWAKLPAGARARLLVALHCGGANRRPPGRSPRNQRGPRARD